MEEQVTNEAELPLGDIGSRLKAAREAQGLSRSDIAARTKIAERHLESIETGNFAALAARTYAVGFARSYARSVGMDEKEVAEAVRSELGSTDFDESRRTTITYEPGDPLRLPSRRMAWLAGLAAFFVVLIAVFAYDPPVSLPSLLPDEKAETTALAAVKTDLPKANDPVIFTAMEQGLWVKFYDAAGTQLMQKEMAMGETYTVPAQANGPLLWTARPHALKITIGGKDVPMLSDRQITMKDVPVSAAALLARGTTLATPAPAQSATAQSTQRPVIRRQPEQTPRRRAAQTQPAAMQSAAVPANVQPQADASTPQPAPVTEASTVSE